MLIVGTEKGLFRLHETEGRRRWRLTGPELAGYRILHVTAAPGRPGELLAASDHAVWGAHIYRSGNGGESWDSLDATPQHPAGRHVRTLTSIWQLAWSADGSRLYAGIDPAGLFLSEDRGRSWQDVPSLNEHGTRRAWEPSRGLFAMHSICIDQADPNRMLVSVSAGGTYRSEDGGLSWEPANTGVRAANLPDPYPVAGHNVHRVVMHPADGRRVYRQCYSGTYRSDDGGRRWTEITRGLPSDFGYAIACDPADPDTVFQVPEMSSHMRTTVDGKLRVFRSRDAGLSWASASDGLPQEHVYVTVLREAMDTDQERPGCVAFGTSSGHVFVSRNSGGRWDVAAEFLPRILCVHFVPD